MIDFCVLWKVFVDLDVDSYQLLMVTVGTALQEIGYTIEVTYLCVEVCVWVIVRRMPYRDRIVKVFEFTATE